MSDIHVHVYCMRHVYCDTTPLIAFKFIEFHYRISMFVFTESGTFILSMSSNIKLMFLLYNCHICASFLHATTS